MSVVARVATDVGGTFTDLVYFETDARTGRNTIRTAKTDTTPPDFERGILAALAGADVAIDALSSFVHGTTVVINALTERKGVRTGLVTTRGFRDILEIGRGNRPSFFDLAYTKPEPFVPRALRREIGGRITYQGHESEPLDLVDLPSILDDFRAAGVQAIAICLLHAYANIDHERRLVAAIREAAPDMPVVASHQITREWREYERSNTTVLSAYVQPIAERYLNRLESSLDAQGYRGPLYIMHSNCGIDSLEATKAIPITMVESGPASGIWGAAELGRLIGEPNVIALDIGGTTAKCSLIEGGHARIKTDYWIERDRKRAGYPIMVPVVDLVEIGNGGGSIAWVDAFGKMHVGPQSAGASPGPAAYGRGGTQATTTDANIALGRINKNYFCGGTVTADVAAVDRALGELAQTLAVAPREVAQGIVRVANNNMINALKLVSVNRGYDPRDFVLVAFGGGGGMHAAALVGELGCRKVVIPRGAAVFSAWGMMMSDLRRDYFVTRLVETDRRSATEIVADLADLVDESAEAARARFEAEGVGPDSLSLRALLKCRYQNQEHAIEVELPDAAANEVSLAALVATFHAAYEREYTYRLTAPIEIVGLHLVAIATIGKLAFEAVPVTGASLAAALKGERLVDFIGDGELPTRIYEAERLEPGMSFDGPAVIEDPGTTIVVHPGQRVTIDRYGHTHIEARP